MTLNILILVVLMNPRPLSRSWGREDFHEIFEPLGQESVSIPGSFNERNISSVMFYHAVDRRMFYERT